MFMFNVIIINLLSLPVGFSEYLKNCKRMWKSDKKSNILLQSNQKLCLLFARTKLCDQSTSLEMCCITWGEVAESKCHQEYL